MRSSRGRCYQQQSRLVGELRFSLQYRGRRSFRWRVAKSYDAEEQDFRVVERVMEMLAREHSSMEFRVVEMPWNMLAAEVRTR